ncbi:MAG: hypothetical protein MZV65_14780 [Chromatiales bacterium]|nr:hypothetical protein [Chromatiales bacterium]
MLLRIPSVLDRNDVELAYAACSPPSRSSTASCRPGRPPRRVKNNLEADRRAVRELEQLSNLVMGKLVQHPVYRSGALPLRVAAPYYARYAPGMRYGDHVGRPGHGRATAPCTAPTCRSRCSSTSRRPTTAANWWSTPRSANSW